MEPNAHLLLALGGIVLLAMATDLLGRRTMLPRVALLIALGIVVGPEALDLLPATLTGSFELITNLALVMVGFLLGGTLTRENLSLTGRQGVIISIVASIGTAAFVFVISILVGVPPDLAALLGAIAAATAPAATVDTALESGSDGPFTRLLLVVVALDDAWGLILFSLVLAVVVAIGDPSGGNAAAMSGLRHAGGAIVLGAIIGGPAALLTGRIRKGQPMLMEALALVFACGGLALLLDVSFLLASIVMGAVVANFARHHEYPFHAIEDIEWPFLAIFFVVAGATLEVDALLSLGTTGIVYLAARTVGKIGSAALGGRLAGADTATRRWMGLALMPQAGAAIGMALVASNQAPRLGETLLPLIIGSTVVFEIVGPLCTRYAIRQSERQPRRQPSSA